MAWDGTDVSARAWNVVCAGVAGDLVGAAEVDGVGEFVGRIVFVSPTQGLSGNELPVYPGGKAESTLSAPICGIDSGIFEE